MKTRTLTLLLALASGPALASGTTAGTVIQNTADATFIDPSTGNPVASPVVSNTVSATVLPVAGVDFVYASPASLTNNDGFAFGAADLNYRRGAVIPGQAVTTTYTLLNNGNINGYVVTLNNVALNNPSGVPVQYFLASDTTFSTPLSTVTLPASGSVDIVQRVTVPLSSTPGTVISVSPYVTAAAGSVSGNPYPAADEKNNVNVPPTPAANFDLEPTDLTVITPVVYNGPTPPANPAAPGTPGAPGSSVVTPPVSNAANPLNPVSAPGTPADPSDPSQPGRTDVSVPSTSIVISGNAQLAYPTAHLGGLPDVTTFSNVAATPQNPSTPADTLSLFPTDGTGLPIGTNNGDGTFTLALPGGPVTVKFQDAAGNPLPLLLNPSDGKIYPVLATPAGGGSVPYRTLLSLPNSYTVLDPVPVVLLVGADSALDAGVKSSATTSDTVFPPAAAFGDVPASGNVPNPALIGPGNAAQSVTPGTPPAVGAPNPAATGDSTAVFPMLITNLGEYNDTFTLSGSVNVPLTGGGSVVVPVRYVDANGTPLASGAAANSYVSPLVTANGSLTVYAVIDLPATASATSGTPLTVSQSATGNYSTIVMNDVNDQIVVASIGSATPVKSVNAPSALPGADLTYTISAQNNYNVPLKNYVLRDANSAVTNVFTYATFKSVTVTLNTVLLNAGAAVYRFNGGAWQASNVPSVPLAAVTSVEVGVNTDGNLPMSAADLFPVGGQLSETLVVTVK